MKITINEIHSNNMFRGLIMGKPKIGTYEKSLEYIKILIRDDLPIFDFSEIKWVDLTKPSDAIEYGTWGHITGVRIRVSEDDYNYDFSIIFNYYPEIEKFDERIEYFISKVDYKKKVEKWISLDL